MERKKLVLKIKELCNYSNTLNSFEKNGENFLTVLKTLEKKYLTDELTKFRVKSIDTKGKLRPVNFVGFLVIDKILKKRPVSLSLIGEFKAKILNQDVRYFNDYPEFKSAILKWKKKESFKVWTNFMILFDIYYDQKKKYVESSLEEISQHLKTVLNMKNEKYIVQGFDWNRNYGTSGCWIALYPYTRKSHKEAYQLFFRISPDNIVSYGLKSGSNVKNKREELDEQNGKSINISKFEDFFKGKKQLYEHLNSKVIPVDLIKIVSKNSILYGPPGTGKTYRTIDYAMAIIENKLPETIITEERKELIKRFEKYREKKQIEFITFHQNYAYEDFVQGLRPKLKGEMLLFECKDGIFKQLADRASRDTKNNYVLIIDEINRANISRVFGELITLIEPDKRLGGGMPLSVTLPSGDKFSIPQNLYLIGTMNTADKSIALVDIALRRRFDFIRMYPEPEMIKNEKRKDMFKKLNEAIIKEKDVDHQIGHSYFMGKDKLSDIFNKKIFPLLLEYFMNDTETVKKILKDAGVEFDEEYGLLTCKNQE